MEKRGPPPRRTRRLNVSFSDGKAEHSGTSSNFSLKGIFIRTRKAFNPGTSLKMVLEVNEHQKIDFTGVVVWATRTGIMDFKNGMGIKITSISQAYEDFVKELS
ncbi:MAG: PilZ domain-containing protein [Thermodesulfovibrionia bacterium]